MKAEMEGVLQSFLNSELGGFPGTGKGAGAIVGCWSCSTVRADSGQSRSTSHGTKEWLNVRLHILNLH